MFICFELLSRKHTQTYNKSLCSTFLVSKESAGAIDEEDFIKAFTDVPTVQVN